MPHAMPIAINESLIIPDAELEVKASRSSGAGGQHVNKTSSRIEINWSVRDSSVLSDDQRQMLLERLASRVSTDGAIRVVASEMRSQKQNRERAEARLADLIRRELK